MLGKDIVDPSFKAIVIESTGLMKGLSKHGQARRKTLALLWSKYPIRIQVFPKSLLDAGQIRCWLYAPHLLEQEMLDGC